MASSIRDALGAAVLKTIAPAFTHPWSPGGKKVVKLEMAAAIALLSTDGFQQPNNARILQAAVGHLPKSKGAEKLYAQMTEALNPVLVEPGSYGTVSGEVFEREGMMGIGGEVAPSGQFLHLDRPLKIGDVEFESVLLRVPEGKLKNGSRVTLDGRFDLQKWGGVETVGGSYIELTGVSVASQGEPRFDGQSFESSLGKKLETFSMKWGMMVDGPEDIVVLDQGNDLAYVGDMASEFRMPGNNPFMGFTASRKIEQGTAADMARVSFNSAGEPRSSQTGKAFELVGGDIAAKDAWYLDTETRTAFRITSGVVNQTVQLREEDYAQDPTVF